MSIKGKLEFDPRNFNFREARYRWGLWIRRGLIALAGAFALAVVLSLTFALVFTSSRERQMRRENRMYERIYKELEPRKALLEDVIAGLQYKDNVIYDQVFHSNAPSVDPMSSLDSFFASDTIPDSKLATYTSSKADDLLERSKKVEEAFRKAAESLAKKPAPMPPMHLPLKDISYPQVGASVGNRYNPYYKTEVRHSGIDLLASPGVEVYATAPGEVIESKALTGSRGTIVRIRHAGGYETLYAHLGTRYVNMGQKVVTGQKIGTVGMTGNAFGPHLHYEIYLNGVLADPINYFFASVSPEDYANMFYMSANTRQSMD